MGDHCACYGSSEEGRVEDKGARGECERRAERGTTVLAMGHHRRRKLRTREEGVSMKGGQTGEPLCLLWDIAGGKIRG